MTLFLFSCTVPLECVGQRAVAIWPVLKQLVYYYMRRQSWIIIYCMYKMMFGFEVTVVNKKGVFLKMTAFLNGAPCSLIEIDQHFRHAHSLQLAPLKRQSVSASLHDAPFQKAVIFIPIALRT
jgi:hypothetical protein